MRFDTVPSVQVLNNTEDQHSRLIFNEESVQESICREINTPISRDSLSFKLSPRGGTARERQYPTFVQQMKQS